MSYYLRRPLWRCTMYGGREMVETFVIVEVDGQATITVTPHVRINTLTGYFKAMHNYPWALRSFGAHPKTKAWEDILKRCRNPWDVLEHVVTTRSRDGHQPSAAVYVPSAAALVLDVKMAITRVAHASMQYLSTHDHRVLDPLTSGYSPWSLTLKMRVNDQMRHVKVCDALFIDDQGHGWVGKMFSDMVNVDAIQCRWRVPR